MYRLSKVIESVKEWMYLPDEFPFLDRKKEQETLRDTIRATKGSNRSTLAKNLKHRDLEALLLMLVELEDSLEIEQTTEILVERMSPWLMRLFTSLFVNHEDVSAVLHLFHRLHEKGNELGADYSEGLLVWNYGGSNQIVADIVRDIYSNELGLSEFYRLYSIPENSSFALHIALEYLKIADKDILFSHGHYLIKLIKTQEPAVLENLLLNYWEKFSIADSLTEVNLVIFEQLGEPYISPDWGVFPKEMKDAFVQWHFLYQIRVKTKDYPQKTRCFSKLYHLIRTSYDWPGYDNLFIIDFGDFVLVDCTDREKAYYCSSERIEYELAKSKNDGIMPAILKHSTGFISARDYIIEMKDDDCIELKFTGMSGLYIEEFIGLKTGLYPDTRKMGRTQ